MNRTLSFRMALFLLVAVPLASQAASSSPLEKANAELRSELKQAMLEGALKQGVQIHTDGIVFVSRDDGMLASTAVTAFDTLTEETLAYGTVVGFTYFSGFGIPPGFYRVYVIVSKGASTGTAFLLDEFNRITKMASVLVGREPDPPTMKCTACATADGSSTIDFHTYIVPLSHSIDLEMSFK